VILWLIWNRTPDVPFWDEWAFVDLTRGVDQGTLQLKDLWAFQNEHRILIPRLIDLFLIQVTNWNRQVEMTFDLGIGVLSLLLMIRCVGQASGERRRTMLLVLPISLLMLSISQFENWLASFQIAFIATVIGVTLCMVGFTSRSMSQRSFGLAVVGALIASLSSLYGLATWIAFLPRVWSAGLKHVLLWGLFATVVIATYLIGFPTPPKATVLPIDVVGYGLAYLGSPLAYWNSGLAQVAACVGIGLMIVNCVTLRLLAKDVSAVDRWVCLALFALACAGMTALGREPYLGIPQAMTPRYQAFSSLLWVALFVVGSMVTSPHARADTEQGRRLLRSLTRIVVLCNVLCLTLVFLALIRTNLISVKAANGWLVVQLQNQQCVFNYARAPDTCLSFFLPQPSEAHSRAGYLEQHHMAIFGHYAPEPGAITVPSDYNVYRISSSSVQMTAGDKATLHQNGLGTLFFTNHSAEGVNFYVGSDQIKELLAHLHDAAVAEMVTRYAADPVVIYWDSGSGLDEQHKSVVYEHDSSTDGLKHFVQRIPPGVVGFRVDLHYTETYPIDDQLSVNVYYKQ
jgi:hypothetical protein